MKRKDVIVTSSTATNYEHRSFLAYLRPTLPLVVFTQVLRGTL